MDRLDEYLKPDASYNRLLREYHKHRSLVIGVDIDSTLYDYHGKGESYEMVRQLVRDLYEIGNYIVIWTGNPNIEFVKSFLADNNIPYNTINEDAPHDKHNPTRKIHCNCYIDDRSGLPCVYNDLTRLVKEVRNEL